MELVIEVYDGDSFATDAQEVRLDGVDTPEEGQPGYTVAKNALTNLIWGKYVTVDDVTTDVYRRTVAQVTVSDGQGGIIDVNATMKQYE